MMSLGLRYVIGYRSGNNNRSGSNNRSGGNNRVETLVQINIIDFDTEARSNARDKFVKMQFSQ